jgi:hypothetical protein
MSSQDEFDLELHPHQPNIKAIKAHLDPIAAILKRHRIEPTVENYIDAAFPGRTEEDLSGEEMQQVREALGLEPE